MWHRICSDAVIDGDADDVKISVFELLGALLFTIFIEIRLGIYELEADLLSIASFLNFLRWQHA